MDDASSIIVFVYFLFCSLYSFYFLMPNCRGSYVAFHFFFFCFKGRELGKRRDEVGSGLVSCKETNQSLTYFMYAS